MTCREKLAIEHPEEINGNVPGGCCACPDFYGYLDRPDYCGNVGTDNCQRCWDREIPETNSTRNVIEKKLTIEEIINKPHILDSGTRREFETGAIRDIQEGKGRCDLMPLDVIADMYTMLTKNSSRAFVFNHIDSFKLTGCADFLNDVLLDVPSYMFGSDEDMLLEVAKHFEEGAKKYGEYNWQKGIPVHCYIDSAVRHYLKFLRGDKDEPHDRAFVWNIMCAIWTCKHKPELNEYCKED